MRTTLLLTAAAAMALAGCATGGSSGTASSGGSAAAPAASSAVLTTWHSPLGTVVATGQGRTVYVFDKDTPGSGTSACAGTCAGLWPAVTTTTSSPPVSGVTGTVGTIPAAGGRKQVTLDGHPLYTYAGDSGAHQTAGQGVMGIWWLVSPTGAKVTKVAGSASSSAYTGY